MAQKVTRPAAKAPTKEVTVPAKQVKTPTKVVQAAPATKSVSEKVKMEEERVAKARQAHEKKAAKAEVKVAAASAAAEEKDETDHVATKKTDSTLCFPLKRDDVYSLYTFVIDLRDEKIIRRYKPFFDRNKYAFTGYVWQGLLKKMINNADDKIAHNVFIKAEDDIICFTITNFDVKKELPEYICPILSNSSLFASYVKKANRDDINNY
jgi:hypothetical protein